MNYRIGTVMTLAWAFTACGPGADDRGLAYEEVRTRSQEILNGTTITNADRNKYLPVDMAGCSGTLLTNDLVLTAEHCRWMTILDEFGNPTGEPPVDERVIGEAARLYNGDGTVTESTITETLPHYSNIPTATSPGNSMGADILIVRVNPPFLVDGNSVGFRRMLWPGNLQQLAEPERRSVTLVGKGPNTTYEANFFDINYTGTGTLDFWNDPQRATTVNDIVLSAPTGNSWTVEGGDSGGGVFSDEREETYLVGINYSRTATAHTFTSHDIASYLESLTTYTAPVGCHEGYAGNWWGGSLYFGDINGDGRDDLICHNQNNGTRRTKLKLGGPGFETNWTIQSSAWCNHSGSKVFVGDFSGDGNDDLLCADTWGRKWVDLGPTFNGSSSGGFWDAGWCHETSQIHVGYFDSDTKADLACQEPSTGRLWIDLGSNGLSGTDSEVDNAWCSHSGSKLYVGKANQDSRTDLLCIDTSGMVYIDAASSTGTFSGVSDWVHHSPMLVGANVAIQLADLDGDGRDDILARPAGSNTLTIDYAFGGFHGAEWTRAQTGTSSQPEFCSTGTIITPRSFDAVGRNAAAELLCYKVIDNYPTWLSDELQVLPR